jgi:hypothetical protein
MVYKAVLCGYYGVDDFGRLLNSHENRDTISPPEKKMMATITSILNLELLPNRLLKLIP